MKSGRLKKNSLTLGKTLHAIEEGLRGYFDNGKGNYVNPEYGDEKQGYDRVFRAGKHSDGYPYIPFGADRLVSVLTTIRSSYSGRPWPKFVDVGCGPGITVALAKTLDFDAYGIEYNPATAELAAKINNDWGEKRIINIDAFKYEGYDQFDVIYFYCPIANPQLEKRLENMLAKKAKPGAWIIPKNSMRHISDKNGRQGLGWDRDLNFEKHNDDSSGYYYRKLATPREKTKEELEREEADRQWRRLRKQKCLGCGQPEDECSCDEDDSCEEDDGEADE